MNSLCRRISKRSKVLVPLPQGDLRVVIFRQRVGMRTGPFTCSTAGRGEEGRGEEVSVALGSPAQQAARPRPSRR